MFRLEAAFFIYTVLCYFSSQDGVSTEVAPTVMLKQGKVSGVLQTSDSGKEYSAFMGIPYGIVPGRFKAPMPAGLFPVDFVANNKSQFCIQSLGSFGILGTEDCLTLHVYTPNLPETSGNSKRLPVMVFIYGGAFVMGSASPLLYGPNHLMEHDIVLVLMNYRVGIFGFLATEDAASPGNYGLLDQNLALKWVQDNINEFGGDNNQVTIFGESAGGASVIYHMVSPLSAGLFQGAIAMSGSSLCPWAFASTPLETARHVAELVNCPHTDDTNELVECLRHTSATTLAAAMVRVTPVMEPENGGLFLTEHPYRLLLEGRFNKVPVISGITLDEFATPMLYKKDPSRFNVSKEDFLETGLVELFETTLSTKLAKAEIEMIQALGTEYFGDIDFNNETALEIADIEFHSDAGFGSSNDLTIKLLTAHNVPVYSYVFEYASDITSPTRITGKQDVGHGSDLAYMFEMKLSFKGRKYSDEAKEFLKQYVSLWTNFATMRDPTPSGPFIWELTPPGANNRFLRLGTHMEMGENLYPKRIAMWNDLFTLIMKTQVNVVTDQVY